MHIVRASCCSLVAFKFLALATGESKMQQQLAMASLPAANLNVGEPHRPCQLPLHSSLPYDGAGGHRSGVVQQVIPPTPSKSPESCGCTQRESWPVSSQNYDWMIIPETGELQSDNVTQPAELGVIRCSSAKISYGVREGEMLGEHPGYHQEITGELAERRLRRCGGHCYLTRFSKKQGCYVLSVHEHRMPLKPVIKHFKITTTENGSTKIEGKDRTFPGIRTLLEYYELNRIDPAMSSIGHAYTEAEYRRSRSSSCTIL